MDAVSPVLINKALDALSMRAAATAQNIANAGTPGYRPLRVGFEEALRAAAAEGPQAIRQFSPSIEAAPQGGPGAELRLDLELATASETAMRYAALIDLLARQLQITRIAVKGGQ